MRLVAIAGSPEDALKVLAQEPIAAAIIDPRLGEDEEPVFVLEEELKRRMWGRWNEPSVPS